MNDDSFYSLCLALPESQESNSFYRIADYNPNLRKFSQAEYDYTGEAPLKIFSARGEGKAHKVEIRKWSLMDDKRHKSVYEELRYGHIYEVLFPVEFIHQPLSDEEIRQVLYKGISLPDGISRFFFIVLDVTSDSYKVLLCDKNAFEYENGRFYIERQIRDLKNAVTEFDLMYIGNDQIITTEGLRNKLNWYNPDKLRYFFDSIVAPESTEKIKLRNPGDYIIGFFSNYLKNSEMRNKYTKKERSNLLTELSYIEDNHTVVERFFADKGEKNTEINDVFIKNITAIIDFIKKSENTELEILLEILEKSPLISSELEKKIETKWMEHFNQNILDKENELKEVEERHDKMKEELDSLIVGIDEVRTDYQNISNELERLTHKKMNIENQITEELNNFQSNIVEQYKLSAFANNTHIRNIDNSGIIEYNSEILENMEFHKSENIADVFEGITFNLENLMDKVDAERYAAMIMAILKTNKLMILPEFHSEDFANALSLIETGQSVKTINILNNQYDLNSVIKDIKTNEDRYVLIKGHLDIFNETAVNTLINQSKKKNIIFTINDEKSLSLFSNNLWNYCVYLNPLDNFDLSFQKHWKKSNNNKIDIPEVNISTYKLPSGFHKRMTDEKLFSKYVQEEFFYLMEVYTALYKELIDENFELTSMNNIPLSHQILVINRDRVSEKESVLLDIGITEDLLEYYK